MKKLMLGTIALLCFSISLLLVQMSCQDPVTAQPTTVTQQQGKILFRTGAISIKALWIMNYDGTNKKKIPLEGLPDYFWQDAAISPDGQTIFIGGWDSSGTYTGGFFIYSMSLTGTNVKKITEHDWQTEGIQSIWAY